MSETDRPSPEDLLRAVELEETRSKEGKLKIFLGMAAGVGKTYTMLEEAQELQREGVDVVVGIISTHGRKDTERLSEGLRVISPRLIRYKDKDFEELNLDEILLQHPKVVLVDELAHSNVPGSRHDKRWQDVKEILQNGINVYSTINIQHVESLKDVVESIADISIRETVPDTIIATAAFIQLVDLSPDELIQRLKEGRVYLGEQSRVAAENFFQIDRLTALREISLRFTAEKVDHDLHVMVSSAERSSSWKPRERLIVAVSHSPHSKKLIRTTRRLAYNLGAPWIALHVDDGGYLSEEDGAVLEANLALARDLGAEVVTTNDPDLIDGIERIARQKGATQIVIGRPPKPWFFGFLQAPTLLDRLAIRCRNLDIHVIRQDRLSTNKYSHRHGLNVNLSFAWNSYLYAMIGVALLTGLNWLLLPVLGYKVSGFVFLLGILFLSLFVKKGPVIAASILYALIWGGLFIPDSDPHSFSSSEDKALLGLYILVAIVTGVLTDRGREHKELLARREAWTQALYEIVRHIASGATYDDILKSVEERLGSLLDGTFQIVVKGNAGELDVENSFLLTDEKERAAAIWVFDNGKEAGWSTATLPLTRNLFIPLMGYHETVGVIVYKPNKANKILSTEARNFLYTVGQQLGNYLERSFASERARTVEERSHMDRIYQTVLKSVSVEFTTPVKAIHKAISRLDQEPTIGGKKANAGQIHRIQNASEGLVRTLDNVSAMAKVSGGLIPLNFRKHKIVELLDSMRTKAEPYLSHHKLVTHIAEGLPELQFDLSLLRTLLHNIILNAVENSPEGSTITIDAYPTSDRIVISVSDEGRGIPADKLDAIFEKFYRLPGSPSTGMGLGLSLAKRIAEIHSGTLKAENLHSGGSKFSLELPS